MVKQDVTQIEVAFGQGECRQLVAWPIVARTEKAWQIQTPGGVLWMPIWRWQSRSINGDKARLAHVLELLADITRSHRDARVLVKKVGKGSTEKSIQVGFLVRRRARSHADWGTEECQRSATLALSLLDQDDPKKWSMPLWAITKKLDARTEQLASKSFWPGLAAVASQLQVAFDAAQSAQLMQERQASEQAQACRLALEEARANQAKLAAERALAAHNSIENDGEMALAFARKHMTLRQMETAGFCVNSWPKWRPGQSLDRCEQRDLLAIIGAATGHPEFSSWRSKNACRQGTLLRAPQPPKPRQPNRVISNATVQWTDWIGAKRRREDRQAQGCEILVFGKKHQITLPDGTLIVKMAGPNLTIIEPAPIPAVAID